MRGLAEKKGCIYRGPTGLEHRLQLGPFGSHQFWPLEARGMIWETFPLSRECFLPVTQPWPGNPHRTACNCLYPLGLRQGKGYPPGRLGRSRLSLRTCKLPPRALTGGSRSQGRPREHKQPMPLCLHVLVRNKSKINIFLPTPFSFKKKKKKKSFIFLSLVSSSCYKSVNLSILLSKQTLSVKTLLGSTQGTHKLQPT